MEALREIRTVDNNRIVIDLPDSFMKKNIEVIILPFDELKNNIMDNKIKYGVGKYNFAGELDNINIRDLAYE